MLLLIAIIQFLLIEQDTIMKRCLFSILALLLTGCQTNYFENFYNDEELEPNEYIARHWLEDVKVVDTYDLDGTLKKYKKEGYVVLGTSAFAGQWCSRSMAVETAKEKGATLVVIGISPLGEQTSTFEIAIPVANTTFHSGTISNNSYTTGTITSNTGNWANYTANTTGTATYTGTSTSWSAMNKQQTITNYYYNQYAYFMAKKATVHD